MNQINIRPRPLSEQEREGSIGIDEHIFSFLPYAEIVTCRTEHWADRTLRFGWLLWHREWVFQETYRGNPTDNAEYPEDSK